ncbi:unnamed protein product [Brassica rapa]|uniref:Uncharacterized protein n=2 Tax=Brassica TaxID=3705 RepID=A0A8D9GY87_BRACM|nr:unnamed protein product [Brassica napus]CAG7888519.1 unnamed protein product [Brassica rapa]
MFKSTAPCFYDECTRGERSRRRGKCKHFSLPSTEKKLISSNTSIIYLE